MIGVKLTLALAGEKKFQDAVYQNSVYEIATGAEGSKHTT